VRLTRLAPSPTGALHLGNARTFLVNWLLARQNGWRIILRIEDLDGPRIKRGADRQAIDDLRWLGIEWDEGPIYQSTRQAAYGEALRQLKGAGHTFICTCSRKDVESAASAPHASDGAAVYPGTCRNVIHDSMPDTPFVIRFRAPDEVISFDDAFAGRQSFDVARQLGDFVISKSDGTPAYQLAVVVDDAAAGVTDIVRGDDLLDSTPRQMLLYRALGMVDRIPRYYHLPLIVGTDGRRLAKRHGDTRLSAYRDAGRSAGDVLAVLAKWCGLDRAISATSASELLPHFDLARLPRSPIVVDPSGDPALRLESRRP
jgi:glutamyl-tRNA synthetase